MARAVAVAFALLVSSLAVPQARAAGPLFPTPLHITRQVQDPISDSTAVLNEYGYGNRLVTVRGNKTAIADYERGELIEIDRDAGTYSITRFEAVAKAAQTVGAVAEGSASVKAVRPLRNVGPRVVKSGRSADFFEGTAQSFDTTQSVEVGVDRTVRLSKEALEVLLGSAYPGVRRNEHEIILAAARQTGLVASSSSTAPVATAESYALPVEQVVRYEIAGQQVEFRNSVTRVASEPPPAESIAIPAGARLVVSRIVAVSRELEQIDHSNSVAPNP